MVAIIGGYDIAGFDEQLEEDDEPLFPANGGGPVNTQAD